MVHSLTDLFQDNYYGYCIVWIVSLGAYFQKVGGFVDCHFNNFLEILHGGYFQGGLLFGRGLTIQSIQYSINTGSVKPLLIFMHNRFLDVMLICFFYRKMKKLYTIYLSNNEDIFKIRKLWVYIILHPASIRVLCTTETSKGPTFIAIYNRSNPLGAHRGCSVRPLREILLI